MKYKAYYAASETAPFVAGEFELRDPLDLEVVVNVKFCGICRADLESKVHKFFTPEYPFVPGHEITGEVSALGKGVTKFKLGDPIGVGYIAKTCGECEACKSKEESYCSNATYTDCTADVDGKPKHGGYGQYVIVHEDCAVQIPSSLALSEVGPMLCAGITAYSPIKHWKMERGGLTIGIVGLGGMGSYAVQFAKKVNQTNRVFVFSRNKTKLKLAQSLGAENIIVQGETEDVQFDYIIDTVCSGKDLEHTLGYLRRDGIYINLGAPDLKKLTPIPYDAMFTKRISLVCSALGSMKEMHEMLEFASTHDIKSLVEVVEFGYLAKAHERLMKGDVQFRFVLDLSTI